MDLFFFAIKYIILLLPILGYGFFFQKYFIKYNRIENKLVSLGHTGLYGIFFLVLISYSTNLFLAHNYTHNLIIFFIGICFFVYFLFKSITHIRKIDSIVFFFLIFISLFSLVLFKNHDDFLYYHFNFITNLTLEKTEFGLGNFDPAFNHISSLFFLNSLMKMPFTEDYFYNVVAVFIMLCINTIIINNIYCKLQRKQIDFYTFLNLFFFLFIIIFFYRISEHGTDISAQIIILYLFIILFEISASKKRPYNKIENFLILLTLTISIKSFYLIYSFLFLFVYFKFYKLTEIRKFFDEYKLFYLCIIIGFFIIMYNFIYTGCFIFPLVASCFDNFFWGQGTERVSSLLNWYQTWSKGGAGPNFRIENPIDYISGFNWVGNWFKIYFFNKVSDTILGIVFLCLILFATFRPKNLSFKFDKNFIPVFIFWIFIFVEWFYIHPALRYGGFHLLALFFFVPSSIVIADYNFNPKNSFYKFKILILVAILIFIIRNINRINNEAKIYNFSILNPHYEIEYSLKKKKDAIFVNTRNCSKEQKFSKKDRMDMGSPNCKIINRYTFFY
jgi:hypothetical protein